MVIREFYKQRDDDVNLFRIYSDEGFEIQKVGTDEIYIEVIDVENAGWNYVETAVQSPQKDLIGDQELTQEEIATMLEEIF